MMRSSLSPYAVGFSVLSVLTPALALPNPAITYPGDNLDSTWDQPDVPKWPIRGVETLRLPPTSAYPNINLTMTSVFDASCLDGKLENYQRLDGTRQNSTIKDMFDDIDKAYNDDGPDDLVDVLLQHALAEATEIYKLANDTLDWFTFTDQGADPLLPLPPQWEDEYRKKRAAESVVTQGTVQTSKERRMNRPASDSDVSIIVSDEGLETPDEPAVPTITPFQPGSTQEPNEDSENEPEPAEVKEPEEIKRKKMDIFLDWVIIVVGSAIGASFSYGGLNAGAYMPYVKDHPWAVNFFGAAGLAIGIISGVIITMIQSARAKVIETINQKAKDKWRSGQIATMRLQAANARKTFKEFRAAQLEAARRAVPNPGQVSGMTRRAVSKPIKALQTGIAEVGEAANEGMKRAGSSFANLKDAVKTIATGNPPSSAQPSDESSSSAPGQVETDKAEVEPIMAPRDIKKFIDLRRARTLPEQCPLPIPNAIPEDTTGEIQAEKDDKDEQGDILTTM